MCERTPPARREATRPPRANILGPTALPTVNNTGSAMASLLLGLACVMLATTSLAWAPTVWSHPARAALTP